MEHHHTWVGTPMNLGIGRLVLNFLFSSTSKHFLRASLRAQTFVKKLRQIRIPVELSGTCALDALSTPIWDKPFPVSVSGSPCLWQNIFDVGGFQK